MHKEYKQIFSLKLAGFLMMNGLPIRRIHHDLKTRNKDVYMFDNDERIERLMIEYSKLKRAKENKNVTNERSGNYYKFKNI